MTDGPCGSGSLRAYKIKRLGETGNSRVCLMIASDNTISTTHAELPPASFIFMVRNDGRYSVSYVHLLALIEPI